MRLLQLNAEGAITFCEYAHEHVPRYAILSHTWHKEVEQEVTFEDMRTGANKSKAGWNKIKFCADRALEDGLQHFWIDTCCIDKKNAVELSQAINSMFRWYQQAARCYVYLSDVSIPGQQVLRQQVSVTWVPSFRNSRWFTRGWTLQELIAPKSIIFYSWTGERLGDKSSLTTVIQDITGIPENALQGVALTDFSIHERKKWREGRQTTIDEDQVYSLLGIFDVSMPIIYGEGIANAYRRLDEEIQKSSKGFEFERFVVGLNLSSMPERTQFVGREKELQEMHKVLHDHKTRSIVVLQGLGGIGKTQLTIEYTRRHTRKYSAILWLDAIDEDSLSLSFQGVARQILRDHPSAAELARIDFDGDLTQVVRAVVAWLDLRENRQWLLIYDNFDNPKIHNTSDTLALDIHRFLPTSDHGSIIITTRSSDVDLGKLISISKLSGVQNGLEVLSRTSGTSSIKSDFDAIALAQELDGFPLALSTAGAYLEQTMTSCSQYLQLYRTLWGDLQQRSPLLSSYANHSLYTTWQISFDQIQRQNPLAAKLIKLWAYFDRQDVWFKLLRHGSVTNNRWIEELTRDELEFNEVLRVLHTYGLVEPSSAHEQFGFRGYSMHSCVHSWSISVLNEEWDENLAHLALTCVASEVPSTDDKDWWLTQRRLLQHAKKFEQFIADGKMKIVHMQWALHSLGDLYINQDKLAEAEVMYVRALQGYEEALGSKHMSTLNTVSDLGNLYFNQGKLAKAELMYVRALQGYEEVLGSKHILTLGTVNDLGNLYSDQGKLAEAEVMYVRALQGYEEALGSKHTSTLSTMNNLSLLYQHQGKLAEAEAMYARALQGKEEALGLEHTSTLDTVNNLGNLYSSQSKLAEAEAMYARALQGKEKALGLEHTSTLDTINNLGILYADQGKLVEAEQMYQRALQGYEKAWGPEHTLTLDTVNNLANLYRTQGKLVEAEQMYQRALQGYEKAWGAEHTSTLDTVNNLANLYADQGKLVEAEQMYQRALQGCEKAWGPEHTSTLDIVNNLGILYADQGKLVEAEQMYQRALQGKEKAWGPEHTLTLDTVNNLANLYRTQGKLVEAEQMYQRALQGYEKAWGPEHTLTLDTVNNLGILYADQGKLVEAEQMYQRALQGKEKAWGPEHTSTLGTVNNLAILYKTEGKVVESEQMYQRALQGYEAALGPDHTSTLDTVSNLGILYQDQGKLAEAEKMYVRALQGYEEALGLELASSYLPALNTMFVLGDLFSQTDRKDMARAMYIRALSGYAIAQGPSSKWCRQLEDRLQALQVVSAESKVGQNEFTEPEVVKSRSFTQKFRKLGRRPKT